MTTDDYVEPDIMTWFPRREDYEDKPEIKPDENYEDKLQRLLETIEAAQNSIKEVVEKMKKSLHFNTSRTQAAAKVVNLTLTPSTTFFHFFLSFFAPFDTF